MKQARRKTRKIKRPLEEANHRNRSLEAELALLRSMPTDVPPQPPASPPPVAPAPATFAAASGIDGPSSIIVSQCIPTASAPTEAVTNSPAPTSTSQAASKKSRKKRRKKKKTMGKVDPLHLCIAQWLPHWEELHEHPDVVQFLMELNTTHYKEFMGLCKMIVRTFEVEPAFFEALQTFLVQQQARRAVKGFVLANVATFNQREEMIASARSKWAQEQLMK